MFDSLLLPPGAEHIPLLGWLMGFLLLFHLPWLGMLLVSSGLSLAYQKKDGILARRFMDLPTAYPAAWWIFGILPPLGLMALSGQFFYGMPLNMPAYFIHVLFLMVPAFLLLYGYRRTQHRAIGGAGHLLLLAAAYFLIGVLDLGFFPERFFFEPSFLPWLFSIQQIVHFMLFSALSILFTGTAILFSNFRWAETQALGDENRLKFLRTLGAGMILAGGPAVPLAVLGELYNLSTPASSTAVYLTALAMVILAWPATQLSFYMLTDAHAKFSTAVFALGLLLFGFFAAHLVQLQTRAGHEHLAALLEDAQAARQKEVSAREALLAKNLVPDVKVGEQIFTTKCSACHAFDHKVVGPAYNDVVPKYAGDPDALKAFIRSPVKKDPAFPPMPAPGLTEAEVQSVAQFLLEHGKGK